MILMVSANLIKVQKPAAEDFPLPEIAILVPFYNEEDWVAGKIENLKNLIYPPEKISIYFLDGCSTDNSCALLQAACENQPNWQLVATGKRGKINQLNYGLQHLPENIEIVINTDMDTKVIPDLLIKIMEQFHLNTEVGVVGANIIPEPAMEIDRSYWQDQNLIRVLESNVYCSSIVVAPFYAFRKEVMQSFPPDCVADDIYTAFYANSHGWVTKYLPIKCGSEMRNPTSLSQFFNHKFRKGNAFLLELFRFLYMLPQMSAWWKTIYITKLFQVAFLPWVLPYFLLSTLSFLLTGGGLFYLAALGLLLLFISLVTTALLLGRVRRRLDPDGKQKSRGMLLPFIITNLIMVLVGISFPFYTQTSNYARVGQKAPKS